MSKPKPKIVKSKTLLFLVLTAIVALVLDQVTKAWVLANVAGRPPILVIEGFARFRYTENTGAAFGFFQGWTWLLSVAAIAIVGTILFSASRVATSPLGMLALGLITGGALGNLTDRLRLGYVVDFIDVYGPRISLNNVHYTFPVFNVADSCITVGAILLIGTLVFGKGEEPVRTARKPERSEPAEHQAPGHSADSALTPRWSAPAGWAGLAVMLAGLFLMAFRQASKRS